jgi:hypothetical protein
LPPAWRDAEHPPEVPREVALIGEAASRGDVGNGHTLAQRRERALQPQLIAPGVGRHAYRLRE